MVAETAARPFQVWLNVVNALLLRDIRVRAGRFYVGYIAVFLMPFAHLGIVLTIFVLTDRVPFVGTQSIIFFGLSILPFVIFVYPSRQMAIALAANGPLLYFPRVKIVDIVVARGLLECANGMAVSAVVIIVLFFAAGEFSPRDSFGIVCALLLTLYLGCAWGFANALVARLFPFWFIAFSLTFPVLWMISGIIINVHAFPSPYPQLLAYNPLLQCVEYLRYSYFEGYPDDLLDVWYVFWFATCLIALSLFFERKFRRVFLNA
jgi:capsular polysaccharide transport system permease protein